MKLSDLYKQLINESTKWYHGTPDSREIEKHGGFTHQTMKVDYVTDPEKFNRLQQQMNAARQSGDENAYHTLLDTVDNYKEYYTYKKPIFLTDKYSVAKTYADPQRAFDYQNAMEKVYAVKVGDGKTATINAVGDRFRFIATDKVKKGFTSSGIPEKEIDKLIAMFNYYIPDNKGIKTDTIAAIGNWLNFDFIDVVGVLDSYHGGNVKSTVRMVLDPTKVKIVSR